MTLEELTGGYIWIDGQPLTHASNAKLVVAVIAAEMVDFRAAGDAVCAPEAADRGDARHRRAAGLLSMTAAATTTLAIAAAAPAVRKLSL